MKTMFQVYFAAACVFAAVHPLFAGYDAQGGYVTLLAANSGNSGESTFVTNIVKKTRYGWSDERDPHAGTNYYCGVQFCSPKSDNSAFTFAGDRLVIGNWFRFLGDNTTITVNDLWLEKSAMLQVSNAKYPVILRGSITVLGTSEKPAGFQLGEKDQYYKVESDFKGDASAVSYVGPYIAGNGTGAVLDWTNQYLELDDADTYLGTFEVRTNACLKLASDLPGSVVVSGGGCLVPISDCTLGTLSLQDGAVLGTSGGGLMTVAGSFTLSGKATIKALGGGPYPRALLVVPATCGALDEQSFIGDGVRFSVHAENGIQTLYAEPLERSVYDESTGYVTQILGGTSVTSHKNIFDYPQAWSDNRAPHSDTNYYGGGKGFYITTNSVFAGRSLTIENALFRLSVNVSVTIPDLRVNDGNSAADCVFSSAGDGGKYYLAGGMSVLSRLTDRWPFAFYGGNDGQTWISTQRITGSSTRAFELRGNVAKAPGEVSNSVEFLGDLSEYYGTIIVGTNFTARLGGSALPGAIRLDTAYSRVDTMAADGEEVRVGRMESLTSTSIAVAETNTLAVTDSLAVTGVLTKNGSGLFAAGGIASAGADAALNVAAGGLRADSAHAFDGIAVTFADGTEYVRDLASDDDEIALYGLFNSEPVAVSGTLGVDIVNFSGNGRGREVALFTVPGSCAESLAGAIRFRSRPKGYVLSVAVADADGDMKTVKAVCRVAAMTISIR